MLQSISKVFRPYIPYLLALLLLAAAGSASAQKLKLKKLALPKNYEAAYHTTVTERYEIAAAGGFKEGNEAMTTVTETDINQSVLESTKSLLQSDCKLEYFKKFDSFSGGGTNDTATKYSHSNVKKIILQYDRQGNYLGLPLKMTDADFDNEDFQHFYKLSKKLIFPLADSVRLAQSWTTSVSDTLKYSTFEMVCPYTITWAIARFTDTMGMKCAVLEFKSADFQYAGNNGMMKALGMDMANQGTGRVWGTVLIDTKTGRLVARQEEGNFKGKLVMKTSRETIETPETYTYRKEMMLKSLTKVKKK